MICYFMTATDISERSVDHVIQEKIQIETNQQSKKHSLVLLGKTIFLVAEFSEVEEEKKC